MAPADRFVEDGSIKTGSLAQFLVGLAVATVGVGNSIVSLSMFDAIAGLLADYYDYAASLVALPIEGPATAFAGAWSSYSAWTMDVAGPGAPLLQLATVLLVIGAIGFAVREGL